MKPLDHNHKKIKGDPLSSRARVVITALYPYLFDKSVTPRQLEVIRHMLLMKCFSRKGRYGYGGSARRFNHPDRCRVNRQQVMARVVSLRESRE